MSIAAVVVASFAVSAIVNEAVRALVLRRAGVPIVRAGLGLPVPPVWTVLPARGQRTAELTLSPWLIDAYVQIPEDDLGRRPYRERTWLANAGGVANALLGSAALGFYYALTGLWPWAGAAAAMTAVCWFARRAVAAYGRLVVVVLWAAAYIVAASSSTTGAVSNSSSLQELAPHSTVDALQWFGALSIATVLLKWRSPGRRW
jgi:hypothetical protein